MFENQEIERGWKIVIIIWIAMIVSLFVYLFVGLYIKDTVEIKIEEDVIKTLRAVLYIISFFTLILTRYIKKLVLKSKGSVQTEMSNIQSPALARYTTALIISLALSESIGIYGLILVLLGKNTTDLYFLIGLSLAAMIYHRPNKEEVINITMEMKRRDS
jgi:hypothetical protein